jgi:hypothetical protein
MLRIEVGVTRFPPRSRDNKKPPGEGRPVSLE